MSRLQIVFLALLLIVASGCSSIRGERADSGTDLSIDLTSIDIPEADVSLMAHDGATAEPVSLGRQDASASFDFEARELYSGSTVEAAELFGQGKVLVTFVQPGCEITIEGGSTIADIAEDHPEAIFVIVHSGGDDDAYKAFAEKTMLFQENMMHLSDTYGSIAARYNVDAYPTTLLIDADMRITSVIGAMDHAAQEEAVETVTTRSIAE